MTAFEIALALVLEREGDYSDEREDRGGKTRYGITEATARRNGYFGRMQALPMEAAESIYRVEYWQPMRLDAVAALSQKIANEVMECGVNCGQGTAVKFLQRSLNAMGQSVAVDGQCGPRTLAALADHLRSRSDGEVALLAALNALQGEHYIAIVERSPSQRRFLVGWLKRCVQ